MQTKKTIKILAINPGTRYIGFAVFYGPELRDWGTKVVKGKWSAKKKEKLKNIVQSLIDQHQPDAIALKKLHSSRSSRQLDSFISAIKVIAGKRGLPGYEYPIKYIEAYYSPSEQLNKRKLAELLAQNHPDLYYELNSEGSSNNRYYFWMFEAIALGTICLHQVNQMSHSQI
ncbi:MAG: crossover junction endodeoxyribonuclease RuvC [Deltaproteobacteria bacterium]|nr:crossover junction endodeoxyribonuclease RuvC [Deltaproteobacteria bacterium]